MIKNLIINVISSVVGLFLVVRFVPGVSFSGSFLEILLFGSIMGLVNSFVKPVLKILTFPLNILTLGLFGLVLNLFLVWLVIDVLSTIELTGLTPLIFTTLIIWVIHLIIGLIL
ncbi:MAG: phage holin family protein [Candidatus Nealsonbacteria bacterium]|nr:phage holin family protein [Candidatus Nealsonbacteria bacterium]